MTQPTVQAIPAEVNLRRLARDFAVTSRLRTEGTRNLLDAAIQAGAQRVTTQGLAYAYDPDGEGPANEDAPWWRQPPGSFVRRVRAANVPIVGKGTATFSFTHPHDAANAVVAALDKDTTGALNVVDDEPALVSEWLPVNGTGPESPGAQARTRSAGSDGRGRLGRRVCDPAARRWQRPRTAEP